MKKKWEPEYTEAPPIERTLLNVATTMAIGLRLLINKKPDSLVQDYISAPDLIDKLVGLLTGDLGYYAKDKPCVIVQSRKGVAVVCDLETGEEKTVPASEVIRKG